MSSRVALLHDMRTLQGARCDERLSTGVTTDGEERLCMLTPAHCLVKGVEAVRTLPLLDWVDSSTYGIILKLRIAAIKRLERLSDP